MLLEVDDVQKQLARAFDIQGGFDTSAVPSVSPVIIVGAGAPVPIDTTERLFRSDQVSGDATHTGLAVILNPSTSSQWLVIDTLWLQCQAVVNAFQLQMVYPENTPGGAPIETLFPPNVPFVDTDSRFRSGTGAPIAQALRIFENGASSVTGMANSISLGTFRGAIDTYFPAAVTPIVLVPNTALAMGLTVNNANWWFQCAARVFGVRQR